MAKEPDHVKEAAIAMSDLNIFYAVIAILEGGTLHSASDAAAQRIIKICKSESGKRLNEFDYHRAKA